jgi:hypothetical protein
MTKSLRSWCDERAEQHLLREQGESFVLVMSSEDHGMLDSASLEPYGDYAFGWTSLPAESLWQRLGMGWSHPSTPLGGDGVEVVELPWNGLFGMSVLYTEQKMLREPSLWEGVELVHGDAIVAEVDAMGEGRDANELFRA